MSKTKKQVGIYDIARGLSLECLHLPTDEFIFNKVTSAKLSRFSDLVVSNFSHVAPGESVIITNNDLDFFRRCSFRSKKKIFSKLNVLSIPLFILSKDVKYDSFCEYFFKKIKIPVFKTKEEVIFFESSYTSYLEFCLTDFKLIHGVLVEIYGTGVLLIGRSGVGKSECALELIKRGHRFISDDAVKLKRLHSSTIVGMAPDNIRNFLELRGVGIVNVKILFGFLAVKQSQKVDLIIELLDWDSYENHDRLFIKSKSKDLLGVKIPLLQIPVSPGRCISAIIETAIVNIKGKAGGYNAVESLIKNLKSDNKTVYF